MKLRKTSKYLDIGYYLKSIKKLKLVFAALFSKNSMFLVNVLLEI